MEYGICLHSVIPVRAEPSNRSEIVSQVLFGELYRITETGNSWIKIKLFFDGYEGWIDLLQANVIGEREYFRLAGSATAITTDLVQLITKESDRSMTPLVIGSSLPAFEESRIRVEKEVFFYEGTVSDNLLRVTNYADQNLVRNRQQLMEYALLYMNSPYMWGGRSPFGIDCSGFVQMVYKLQGIKLLRDASQQAGQGEIVSLLAEAEPGDLAFFDDAEGNIIHVGVLTDRSNIIHCSGHVKIDFLDHEGIYNANLQKYTHKLRLIRRIL
jgi:gamma-D-glutamyl-L-lysine dipeptidyl-peptidase